MAYLLVFAASFCTLVLEIVAGRVLAPAIGVSLYTWTTVIGVVLAGVAVGNYVGGVAAGRAASARTLAGLLLVSGLVVWLVALLARTVDMPSALIALDPVPRLLALVGGFFLLPSVLLGAVTPLVAQLTLRERAEAGAVVGRLGAVSAAGSIGGTFATGFLLIPSFGTRNIMLGVAVVLALLGVLAGWRTLASVRLGRQAVSGMLGGALLLAAGTGYALARDRSPCLRESPYYCIRVDWLSLEGVPYVMLRHDRIIQGYTAPGAPRLLVADYMQTFADVAAYRVAQLGGAAPDTLFVGGGSYTLPRYLEAVYPGSRLDVMEVDPTVTENARQVLGVRTEDVGGGIAVRHGDARLSIRQLPDGAYDLVYGDAFNDISVPWHLTTVEFGREVRRVLRPEGLYVINVIDAWDTGRFLPAFVRTLREVFPEVAVLRVRDWDRGEVANWTVVGSNQRLDAARLEAISRPGLRGPEPARARVLPPAELERWLSERRAAPVLTDDYAPVDRFLTDRYLDP